MRRELRSLELPPLSYCSMTIRSRCISQHFLLQYLQSVFLHQGERPSFTPIQDNRQNYSFLYWVFAFRLFCEFSISTFILVSMEVWNSSTAFYLVTALRTDWITILRSGHWYIHITENRCLGNHRIAADVTVWVPFQLCRECFSVRITAYTSWFQP
jgi:hypothetical protein